MSVLRPEELADWFAGKALSSDWTSRFFADWARLLAPRRHEPLDLLEIGSWEGRSALFFLNYLPASRLTCVDSFAGSPEHHAREKWLTALPHIEARFDANLAPFAGRVEKIKARSTPALARLLLAGRRFDLVYLDGSHHSADVLADAVLSWPLLRPGGLAIFDDYAWNLYPPDDLRHPKQGVDAFLAVQAGRFRERLRGEQVIVEKTGDD